MTATVGILGAGKVGTVLARLAARAGYRVLVAGSGAPQKIELTVQVLAPGAEATTADVVAAESDIVILALPLGKHVQLDAAALRGKVVADSMNYWWETDGHREDLGGEGVNTTRLVASHLEGARIVKAFNHMGYHDLEDFAQPAGTPGRRAIAVASDDADAAAQVAALVDALGFDPLVLADLDAGIALQPGHPAFGANTSREELLGLVAAGTVA